MPLWDDYRSPQADCVLPTTIVHAIVDRGRSHPPGSFRDPAPLADHGPFLLTAHERHVIVTAIAARRRWDVTQTVGSRAFESRTDARHG